jgi:hypothetical protein
MLFGQLTFVEIIRQQKYTEKEQWIIEGNKKGAYQIVANDLILCNQIPLL